MLENVIKIWKQKDKIFDGIKNNIFRQEHIEEIAYERLQFCKENTCGQYDITGDKCAVIGTAPCCADCGCCLALKLRSLASECPKGLWKAELTDCEAAFLEQQIKEVGSPL